MIEVTLLGTGSPIPDANRAGPVDACESRRPGPFLVDCGRGVQTAHDGRRRRPRNGLTALLLNPPAQATISPIWGDLNHHPVG